MALPILPTVAHVRDLRKANNDLSVPFEAVPNTTVCDNTNDTCNNTLTNTAVCRYRAQTYNTTEGRCLGKARV